MIQLSSTELAYRRLFSTDDGIVVLDDLMKSHYISQSTFESPEDAASLVAYREGGKNAVLRILAMAGRRLTTKEEENE